MLRELETMAEQEIEQFLGQLTAKYEIGTKLQLELLQDLEKTRKTIDTVVQYLARQLQENIANGTNT